MNVPQTIKRRSECAYFWTTFSYPTEFLQVMSLVLLISKVSSPAGEESVKRGGCSLTRERSALVRYQELNFDFIFAQEVCNSCCTRSDAPRNALPRDVFL